MAIGRYADTIFLQDWERDATHIRRFELSFEQYLARWHQEDLARLFFLIFKKHQFILNFSLLKKKLQKTF